MIIGIELTLGIFDRETQLKNKSTLAAIFPPMLVSSTRAHFETLRRNTMNPIDAPFRTYVPYFDRVRLHEERL